MLFDEPPPLDKKAKFHPVGYNDVGFAVAFFVQAAAVFTWVAYCSASGDSEGHSLVAQSTPVETVTMLARGTRPHEAVSVTAAAAHMVILAFFGVVVAIILAMLWLAILRACPTQTVWVSLIALPALLLVMALLLLIAGAILPGLILGAIGACVAFMVWCVSDHVEWNGQLLKGVSTIYANASSIFLVAFGVIALQAAWQVLLLISIGALLAKGGSGIGFILLILSLYWGSQTLSGVLHVTCAGVVGRWYFREEVEESVTKSGTQACSNYFGSICFGSLLIAIVQTLRYLAEQAKDKAQQDGNIAAEIAIGCLDCLLGMLESAIRFFNSFAFCIVAVYGVPFLEAGHHAWNIMDGSAAFDMLMTYNLSGLVGLFACIASGCGVAFTNLLLALRLGLPGAFVVMGSLLGFFMGAAVMGVASRMVQAGVEALFVCFAEEPFNMQRGTELGDILLEKVPLRTHKGFRGNMA